MSVKSAELHAFKHSLEKRKIIEKHECNDLGAVGEAPSFNVGRFPAHWSDTVILNET